MQCPTSALSVRYSSAVRVGINGLSTKCNGAKRLTVDTDCIWDTNLFLYVVVYTKVNIGKVTVGHFAVLQLNNKITDY